MSNQLISSLLSSQGHSLPLEQFVLLFKQTASTFLKPFLSNNPSIFHGEESSTPLCLNGLITEEQEQDATLKHVVANNKDRGEDRLLSTINHLYFQFSALSDAGPLVYGVCNNYHGRVCQSGHTFAQMAAIAIYHSCKQTSLSFSHTQKQYQLNHRASSAWGQVR